MLTRTAIARKLLLAGLVAAVPAAAHAQVSWTDWTAEGQNAFGIPTVTGTMDFLGSPVTVTYTGPYFVAQLGCGTDYWINPTTYQGPGVPNAPTNCEIIELSQGGTKTVTFSSAVVDPLLALVSWNGQPGVPFSGENGGSVFTPTIEVVNNGPGYWGSGSIGSTLNVLNTSGEAHGTVRLKGTFTSFTFADASEGWHGITVGATSLAVTAAPEPATVALTATGLLALVGVARRRRR